MKTKIDKSGEQYIVFSYRVSTEKYEILKKLAKKNKRAINAEIDMAVEKYIESENKTT